MSKQQDTIDNNPTIEIKKDWRRDNLATRIDLRMPNEVYDRVIEIAIASGEKINPKTSQVRVTATLNKLIEIGIRYYPEDNPIALVNIGQSSDSIGLEEKYRQLSDKYRELESIVSDINPIVSELSQDIIRLKSIDLEETIKTNIERATKPIDESINELETYTRSQFAALREELKKPLAVAQTQQGVVTSFDLNPKVEESKLQQVNSTQIVNNDWDEALVNLVETGMRSTGIAQKLTEKGYTNAKGGVIDRKSVEQRIARQPELKELYQKLKPE